MRPTVAVVSVFDPDPEGHGGEHRTYQLLRDVARFAGDANVRHLSFAGYTAKAKEGHRTAGWLMSQAVQRARANPLKLAQPGLLKSSFCSCRFDVPEFTRAYSALMAGTEGLLACVLEDPGFAHLARINQERGIPTVACPQNIEALDRMHGAGGRLGRASALLDMADELAFLRECTYRLMISRVEAGFVSGVGLDAGYYAYRPVGAIRDALVRTRKRRETVRERDRTLLVLGSAGHGSTREGISWFLQAAREHGLPAAARVTVAGSRTETLSAPDDDARGIVVRGRVPQTELDGLLASVAAVVVPQFRGFGTLTRLAEMSCAGIPVVTASHPAMALTPPPGITAVASRTWADWSAAIDIAVQTAATAPDDGAAYAEWERHQPDTLVETLRLCSAGTEGLSANSGGKRA